MELKARWRVPGLSLAQRRVAVGAAPLPSVLSVTNYHFSSVGSQPWLGRFVGLFFLILWAVMTFVGPTVAEPKEYQAQRRGWHEWWVAAQQGAAVAFDGACAHRRRRFIS